ncbi:MAG TPA: hypothetical protein PKZ84_21765 [Anaerolineae bacterium]|nr:hypothetical protein [Anaerolineae bacterium]HQI87207.1 hypothetical protein [Anaerolineae bacterium]
MKWSINQIKGHIFFFFPLMIVVLLVLFFLNRHLLLQKKGDISLESVVAAFRDAGLEISQLQTIDYYPGPLKPGNEGLKFLTNKDQEDFYVFVILYTDSIEAQKSTKAVNELNQRMEGQFGYAYCRGRVLLLVGAYKKSTADKINRIMQQAKSIE